MANCVENEAIYRIDQSRSGVELSVQIEQNAENRACLELWKQVVLTGREVASQYDMGSLQLWQLESFYRGKLGAASRDLRLFKRQHPERSRRQTRRLSDTDEDADLRKSLQDLETKAADFQRIYDEIVMCLQAREYLKAFPDFIVLVMGYNRRDALQLTARVLHDEYPD